MGFRWDNGRFCILVIGLVIVCVLYKVELQEFLGGIREIGNGGLEEGLKGLIPFGVLMLLIAGLIKGLVPCGKCVERDREEELRRRQEIEVSGRRERDEREAMRQGFQEELQRRMYEQGRR